MLVVVQWIKRGPAESFELWSFDKQKQSLGTDKNAKILFYQLSWLSFFWWKRDFVFQTDPFQITHASAGQQKLFLQQETIWKILAT